MTFHGMSAAERLRWDARYATGAAPQAPSRVLTALSRLLPRRGRALDVAGGAGRHAIWMARRGLRVTVADISPEGLALARARAAAAGVRLRALTLDLDRAPIPRGPWDLIVVYHYLQRRVWTQLPRLLARNGTLVIIHPTTRNLERHSIPQRRHLLKEGEMSRLVTGLAVVRFDEGWTTEGRHEAVLVARYT